MKVNVVTGGGSGIGKAVAAMLPKDEMVIITGRSVGKLEKTVEELNASGCRAAAAACDVSRREDVKKLAEYAASLGEISKVIHCAGVSGSMADRETIMRINALGTVHVNQEFYKVMDGGCIVDIASDSGYMLPGIMLPGKSVYRLAVTDEEAFIAKMVKKAKLGKKEEVNAQIAYMISKNFARWYAECCAFKYMANKGIRVLSVSPGFVKTPMTDKEQGEATDTMLSYTAFRRGAEPEELAYVITALADDRARYLIGTDILCDGGAVNNGYGMLTATKRYKEQSLKENW
jgi:NAD(P)-dependent dehydrogenase (short-subunit alcohol dehydrogenase family)